MAQLHLLLSGVGKHGPVRLRTGNFNVTVLLSDRIYLKAFIQALLQSKPCLQALPVSLLPPHPTFPFSETPLPPLD